MHALPALGLWHRSIFMPTCQGRYAPPEAVARLLPQARTILKYALFYHGTGHLQKILIIAVHSKRQEYIWLCRRRDLLLRRLHQWSAAKDPWLQNTGGAVRLLSRPHLHRLNTTWHHAALPPSTRGFAPPSGNQRCSTLICYVFENYCNLILQFAKSYCIIKSAIYRIHRITKEILPCLT